MAEHTMKLQPLPFEQMKAATKTIELRLNDDKRKAMLVGDTVVFLKEPELMETLVTRITERLTYSTFAELKACFPAEMLGVNEGDAARPPYYTDEDERRYGALGLRIETHG